MSDGGILITGASGNVGSEVVRLLDKKDVNYVVAERTPDKNEPVPGVRRLDFTDESTFSPALQDIKSIFLMRPPSISNVKKYFHPFLDACKREGVVHIVFLSLQGAESNEITPHRKIEKYIEEIGIYYTFVRPSFFMQNLTTTHLQEIKEGEIFIPAGKGKTNFVDVRDVAEVVAKTLVEGEDHYNCAYEITGRENLTYYQVAETISQVADREIEYKDPNIISFFLRKRREGQAAGFIFIMIALYTLSRMGKAGQTADDFEKLTGREPISFRDFVEDNAEKFKTG
jgi:uncharacterized protein YbjT (DUF2867 family)